MSSPDSPPKPKIMVKIRMRRRTVASDAVPGEGTLASHSAAALPPSSAALPRSSDAPAPSPAAPPPPSLAPTRTRSSRTTAGKGGDVARVSSSPAPMTRRCARTSAGTGGAMAQGLEGRVSSSTGAGPHQHQQITDLPLKLKGAGSALAKESNGKEKYNHELNSSMDQSQVVGADSALAKEYNGKEKSNHEVNSSMDQSKVVSAGNALAKESNGKGKYNHELNSSMDQSEVVAGTLVGFPVPRPLTKDENKKVALLYNEGMLLHTPPNERYHEVPMRLTCIMEKLSEEKIIQSCDLVEFTEADEKELKYVHSDNLLKKIRSNTKAQAASQDLYYSEGSTKAAFLAAGAVSKACEVTANGMYEYAFAVVRPPGHHASKGKSAGFCLVNNIAVGAAHLLRNHRMGKILIVDFDIHHGDGTEKIFYDDPRVLTFSVHRFGSDFYPRRSGSANQIGRGSGIGFNVNVTWKNPGVRDVDYFAVWDHCLIPLAHEFQPDIILISAGFDAAANDPLGKCHVTSNGFATLLHKLKCFGRIVLALEGGYHLPALSDGVAACMKVLLGDDSGVMSGYSGMMPYDTTWQTIMTTRKKLSPYWDAFDSELSEEITSKSSEYVRDDTIGS